MVPKAIFFSFFLGLLSMTARADSNHLVISGSHFGEGARIYNCLSYQKCDWIETSFEGSMPNGKLHLYVPRSISEILDQLGNCDLSLFHGKAQIVRTIASIETFELLTWASHSNSQFLGPAINAAQNPNEKETWMKELDHLIRAKNWPKAVSSVLNFTHWDSVDYEILVDKKLRGFALTEHLNETIRLPANDIKNSCDLIFFLRHELEHVQQNTYANHCLRDDGIQQAFLDHDERERAAYLGDINGTESFCPSRTAGMISDRWKYIQDHYLHSENDD